MTPKFISGPPGTGKTSTWLTNKYVELLNKYSHSNILVLSHTNDHPIVTGKLRSHL